MILLPEDRKLIIEALVYLLKSAYTDEQIKAACGNRKEVFDDLLATKKDKLEKITRLIYLLKP